MNGSQVGAAAGITGNVASIIVWLSNAIGTGHWFPVSSETAIALATLLTTTLGATGVAWWHRSTRTTETATVTTEATKP